MRTLLIAAVLEGCEPFALFSQTLGWWRGGVLWPKLSTAWQQSTNRLNASEIAGRPLCNELQTLI